MAGGTGGHVFPGLALARELQQRGFTVEWLGTTAGIESRLVPEADIALHVIPVKGVRGKKLMQKLTAPLNILSSVNEAMKILKKLQPNVVVGLGGFVAGPGGLAAKLLGLPLVIHEQNAVAGTTNKILAKFANRVLTAFPISLKNSICIGNPVREEIESLESLPVRQQQRNDSKIHILVLGGSRGAQAINQLMPAAFAQLGESERLNLSIWHQTGEMKLDETLADYEKYKVAGKVNAFIDDMAEAYAWADLVVCRAGALTVSEIAAVGVGALFIPFPYAIDDHQTANAKFLQEIGAAEIKQQSELNAGNLAELLKGYIQDSQRLIAMAEAARQFAKPKAAKVFANHCEELANA